jgi:putative ATP-dependent endonuclease of OLD family
MGAAATRESLPQVGAKHRPRQTTNAVISAAQPRERTMRVSRLLLHEFRGWEHLDLRPAGHALIAGVPRAGRTDIIAALMRVLDPGSVRIQPSLADIRQTLAVQADVAGVADEALDDDPSHGLRGAADGGDNPTHGVDVADAELAQTSSPLRADFAEVEVTLVDLDPEVQQLCDGYLEPQDAQGQASDEVDADPAAPWCVRVAYRVTYDALTDALDQVVYFPVRSNPPTAQFSRVPTSVRRALPVVVLSATRPLQLRAEGTLRRLISDRDPEAAAEAFLRLRDAVADATTDLSVEPAIAGTVDAVLAVAGASRRLGDAVLTAAQVMFQAEDGSQAALLRAVQPALHLDDGGLLPLASHGSTAAAVLSAAEALLLADMPGAVVLADDFGDQLDSATTEHLAAMLRARAGQLWLSTRRPETARAFEPDELVRLTRHAGVRRFHKLEKSSDRKALAVLKLLHTQLLPALTSPTVAIAEGPQDVASYMLVDRRRAASTNPLSAVGVRIISADSGSGGGTSQIPKVAALARQLGFRVVGLIDGDRVKGSAVTVLAAIEAACDVVVRLPDGIAIEGAIVAGIPADNLRVAASTLTEFGIPDPTAGVSDDQVAESLRRPLHAHGLHEPFLDVLIPEAGIPPLIQNALDTVAEAASADYNGPPMVTLATATQPASSGE